MADQPKGFKVTVTLTVEHVDGPFRVEDREREQAIHSIEQTLLNLPAIQVPYSGPLVQAEYQITAVQVEDVQSLRVWPVLTSGEASGG